MGATGGKRRSGWGKGRRKKKFTQSAGGESGPVKVIRLEPNPADEQGGSEPGDSAKGLKDGLLEESLD